MEPSEIEKHQQYIDRHALRAQRLQQLEHETAENIRGEMDNLAHWVDHEATINQIGRALDIAQEDEAWLGRMVRRILNREIKDAAHAYAERKLDQEEENSELLMQIGAARI